VIPGSISGDGTNIYLGLIRISCSLAIDIKSMKKTTISEMVASSSYKNTIKNENEKKYL
jgi:hypothetical protein